MPHIATTYPIGKRYLISRKHVIFVLVMPLVHESRPKCYICHKSFDTIETLRDHQNTAHDIKNNNSQRTAALGDVSVF